MTDSPPTNGVSVKEIVLGIDKKLDDYIETTDKRLGVLETDKAVRDAVADERSRVKEDSRWKWGLAAGVAGSFLVGLLGLLVELIRAGI